MCTESVQVIWEIPRSCPAIWNSLKSVISSSSAEWFSPLETEKIMSQIFDENGHVIPVTVIEAGPCVVTMKKTAEKDGYESVQMGFEDVPERKLNKPEMGHLTKAGVTPKKHLREFKLENAAELNVGDLVKADTFKTGDFVDVTGTSKGHGYAGVIKRWGAQRTPTTHGGGPVHRHAGSMDPSKLYVSEVFATPGPILKRMMPRAQGRSFRINKRSSHVTLAVAEKA